MPPMYLYGSSFDVLHYSNSVHRNFTTNIDFVDINGFGTVIITNVTFVQAKYVSFPGMKITRVNHLEIDNINISEYTTDTSTATSVITLDNSPETFTSIKELSVDSCNLYISPVIKFLQAVNSLKLVNGVYTNLQMPADASLISLNTVQELIFMNHSVTNVKSMESSDESSNLLDINIFDLSGTESIEINEVSMRQSSISSFKIHTMINSPPSVKTIIVRDFAYTNSEFTSQRSLITTEGLVFSVNVSFIFQNITFENINFTSKGYLMRLSHQLQGSVVIQDSQFINLVSAGVVIVSSNLQNDVLITQVQIIDSTFTNASFDTESLLTLNEGAYLQIHNCTFSHISTLRDGAILTAGYQKTQTNITDTVFQNNTAINAALFNIESESIVKCSNCMISNNFAVSAGVVKTQSNGLFEFYNTTIIQNYALNNPMAQLFDSVSLSIIDNTLIHENHALSQQQILYEFNTECRLLCYLPVAFKQYLLNNELISIDNASELIQLISAALKIKDSTKISQQTTLFNVFMSTLEIENTEISNITISEISVKAVTSQLTFTNMNIRNVTSSLLTDFIFLSLDSDFTIINTVYEQSGVRMFNVYSSKLVVQNLTMNDINSPTTLFTVYDSNQVNVEEVILIQVSANSGNLINIDRSSGVNMDKVTTQDSTEIVLNIVDSNITSLANFDINKCKKTLNIRNSIVQNITSSIFNDNGGFEELRGGAIVVYNSDVTIHNSTFTSNTAVSGGAIHFDCSSTKL